ncbi:MAG: hypothetical protein QHG98_07260 [Methanothrix sp.]|jgi:DNA-binding transcriptional regulator YhcF (GntR family)|nr:hypothetical protein [Methanothrix sp.]
MHDDTTAIVVRDVPVQVARWEINRYIDQQLKAGTRTVSAGEIACELALDLDVVLNVMEERGFVSLRNRGKRTVSADELEAAIDEAKGIWAGGCEDVSA